MNDNSIEEVYYKPHNSPLDFKDESCFSAEISKIEHIPKYREKKENDRRGLVNYQESSERIVQENNTQNGYKQFVDTFGSYNRQSRKNWNSKSPRGKIYKILWIDFIDLFKMLKLSIKALC